MGRERFEKTATKVKLVKPAKLKPSVGRKKTNVQPKNNSSAARNVQGKAGRGKRKKVVDNLKDVVHQEALESPKISPMKKRKLEHISEITPSDSDEKKIPIVVREEEKQKKEMVKSKKNLRLYKQVYINVTRLDKSILNEANLSIFSNESKTIVTKKMNGDVETDQVKDKLKFENSEKILRLEQIIDELKSEKVVLQDDSKNKNEELNAMIKEKEEYKDKFVNEAQKCNEIKKELERVKVVREEVDRLMSDKVDRLMSEKEELETEIKNKDKTLNLVNKDKNEVSLKFKDASEKITWVVELNQELREEIEELKNTINSMKAKHKIDHDLRNTTIEELMVQAKSLTLSKNQMSEKVDNLTKELDLKDLKIQNITMQLEEVNKRAESFGNLYEEKRNEVESLIKINEEKDKEWDNIFKKSEEQMEELGLLWSQFKQKTCEVESFFNQTQEKQKQFKRITRQNKEESHALEGPDSEMEKERDSFNSQEERRIVDENIAEKVKELQNKFVEEKEISVNRTKKDSEEIQNLKAQLTTVKTHFQHFFQNMGNQSPSENQLSQSSLPKGDTNPAHFQEDPYSFHGVQSSVKESQPFCHLDSSGVDGITETPNDQRTSFTDDDNSPDGPVSLSRSKQLGEIASNGPASLSRSKQLREIASDGPASLSRSKQLEEIASNGPASLSRSKQLGDIAPDGPVSLSRSKQLGEIASELRDEVMQLLPPIQEKEAEDKRMIRNARQILYDVIEYRNNLDQMKKQCAARLSQVSKALALKND